MPNKLENTGKAAISNERATKRICSISTDPGFPHDALVLPQLPRYPPRLVHNTVPPLRIALAPAYLTEIARNITLLPRLDFLRRQRLYPFRRLVRQFRTVSQIVIVDGARHEEAAVFLSE